MKTANRVIKNTGILYAKMAITVVLSLYTTRVVLNSLGVTDFGIFNLVGGLIAMLAFLNASMAAATQRFMSFAEGQGDEGRLHQIFNVSMVLHLAIAIAVLILLEVSGFILFDGVLKIDPARLHAAWLVYQFAIASTFFTILGVPYDAVINARENMLFFAVLGIIEAIFRLCIALLIEHTTADKLQLYGLLIALLTIVLLVIRILYCNRRYIECGLALKHYFSRPLFNEMTSFAGWSLLGSSSSIIANYGQGAVLNVHFGTSVNAAQAVTTQLSGQLSAFASTMLRALNPIITKSAGAGNFELMTKASMLGSKFGFFLLMFFYIPILIEMPYVLNIWLNKVPQYAVIFCELLLIRNLIEQLFITLVSSINSIGNIKSFQIITSILTFLPLPITYFGFEAGWPPYEIYVVFLIYSIITSATILFFASKLASLSAANFLINVVFRCFCAFIVVMLISASPLCILQSGVVRLAMVCLMSLIAFLMSVWWIGFNNEERSQVNILLKSLLIKLSLLKLKYFYKG